MDVWWDSVMRNASDYCEPTWLDAEDPLFILYTRSEPLSYTKLPVICKFRLFVRFIPLIFAFVFVSCINSCSLDYFFRLSSLNGIHV